MQRSHLNAIKPVRKPARRTNIQKREWAHEVDINKPMTNFHELVPEMAHKVGQLLLNAGVMLTHSPEVPIRARYIPEGGSVPFGNG